MASVTIITDIFRASYVNLKEPRSFSDGKDPTYSIKAMFPKSGQGSIAALGVSFPSSNQSVIAAIKQVVMEEFKFDFDPDNLEFTRQCGIQFPPVFEDGDKKFKKDENKLPMPGVIDPISEGNWLISFKNDQYSQPGCVNGVTLSQIDPGAIYSGCWLRAQLEVSAFTTKNNPTRIISIKLLNVMMCYDDESFGGAGPKQDAASAFAGMAVTNSNLSVGVGQGTFQPMTQAAPAPQKPGAPVPPSKPTPPAAMVEKLVMNPDSQYTYEQLTKEYGWTDKEIVDGGYATMQKQPAAPAAPVKPAAPTPPAKPVPPKPAPSVPTTGTVIMNPDSQYTYEQLTKEYGWTDKEIIDGGYGKPNFTNPQ